MTYRLKVSLPGIKGFARIYEVNSKNTLYQLHKQMVADMEFPMDQVVLFKAMDITGAVVAKYATFDLGNGSIEDISFAHVVENEIVDFTYFYDTINKKNVIITFEGEGDTTAVTPTLVDSKGPNPEAFLNGYVAFEDLPPEKRRRMENPDDEDLDDEDEDSEDEDEEPEFEDGYDEDSYED